LLQISMSDRAPKLQNLKPEILAYNLQDGVKANF